MQQVICFARLAAALSIAPGVAGQADPQASDSAEADYMRLLANQLQQEKEPPDETKSHELGLEKLKTVWAKMRLSATSNRSMFILWAIAGAAIGLILGYFLRKILMSFCCSVVGSSSILVGVIALFFAKGTPVLSSFQSRGNLLIGIFLIMIAFGWLVQIMSAGAAKLKTAKVIDDEEQKK